MKQPNVLFIMCDQLRADSIHGLGNEQVETPNIDRLVARGINFSQAYSSCPVCIPARYTIRTGREPYHTGYYSNSSQPFLAPGQEKEMEKRCGDYIAARMKKLGYHSFGVGKYHACPWDEELGFDIQLYCEELYESPRQRAADDYAAYIYVNYPAYRHVEQVHGERTDMYYMPQMSPFPAECTGEAWVADRTCELIKKSDTQKPWFGFASFIAPHPPLAPPIPYNRMYNPDKMPLPIRGDINEDHKDEQIPWMNHLIWADDISEFQAKSLRARYYAEVSYVDACIGKLIDCVESLPGDRETMICFFSDHGDHLGDHHGWQKESFFEQSTHIPLLVSWPGVIPPGCVSDQLASLTDLFGIATRAAGACETRDGTDLLGEFLGQDDGREWVFGYYGEPGTHTFKIMVRSRRYKYIYFANGSKEQLFDMWNDRDEINNLGECLQGVLQQHRKIAEEKCRREQGLTPGVDANGLLGLPYRRRKKVRIHQFDESKGIHDFLTD